MLRNTLNFESLLEAAPDAMVGLDQAGVIRFANHQTEVSFGYDRADLVGRSIDMLVPECVRKVHRAHRAGYFADPKTRPMGAGLHLVGRRRDGTEFPVEISLSSLGTGDDMVVIAAMRDGTERNKGDLELQQMAAIIENSDDAIIGKTLDGVVTSWNPAAERMFGYSSDDAIGESIEFLSPEDRAGENASTLARIEAGLDVDHFETLRVGKDGTVLPVSLRISPIRDAKGTVVGASSIARDMTKEREAFDAARSMIESSLDSLVAISPDGKVTDVNEATVKVTGIPREELIGTAFSECFTEPGKANAIYQLVFEKGMAVDYPLTMRHRDGALTEVLYNASVYRDASGKVLGVFAAARDVTALKHAAETTRSLVAAEDLVGTVLASASIGIALADLDGTFRVANRALCDLVGYDEAWFLAHRVRDIVHPEDFVEGLFQAEDRVLAGSTGADATKVRLVRADGTTVWVRQVAVLIRDADGEPSLIMLQAEDITAEHEAQQALTYQAFHDPLTGLHNRAWVLDILAIDLRDAEREGHSVGALFVDLDNFKMVNDSLGHAAGDEVLATVANRITAALRPGERVGRFGGDEFVIVVEDVKNVLEVERCAERVSASIAVDLQVRDHRILPAASIGIATSNSSSTPESLLQDADSALSWAKASGRTSWHFFDEAMHAQALARLIIEEQLREAIARAQFVVHYQPIVALADSHVVGHEALVRWAHPTRGLLSPVDFLGFAEDTALISAIGAQVLDQACTLLADRPDLPGPISINVSAVQLATPDWLAIVQETLLAHQVDPARIVIEVTETAVLSLADAARNAFALLRGLGVGIHVDDFGTGYSSISVLRDLPVTGVKLDLRFVQDLTEGSSQANALAHGVSGLVKGMQLTGIAEGIETQSQAAILRAQGWECGQGYYFGEPAPTPMGVLPRV